MTLTSPRSLRRLYLDWVEDQVEAYKDTISRSELLSLADEVVSELRMTQKGQYQLTEVLLCDAVDRKIFRLLKLPSYRTWRDTLAEAEAEESSPDEPPAPPTATPSVSG